MGKCKTELHYFSYVTLTIIIGKLKTIFGFIKYIYTVLYRNIWEDSNDLLLKSEPLIRFSNTICLRKKVISLNFFCHLNSTAKMSDTKIS